MGGKARRLASPGARIQDALIAVASILNRNAIGGMVIGGIAAISYGVPRVTRDIDVAIPGDGVLLEDVVAAFSEVGIVPRITDAIAFAQVSHVLLLVHQDSLVEVDASLAFLPFELRALSQQKIVCIAGVDVPLVSPDDLIIYKALAWRPQDVMDIRRLLQNRASQLNIARIRQVVGELCELLEEPFKATELDLLLRELGLY